MTIFTGTQTSESIVNHSSAPVDRNILRANSVERNGLDITQRRVGMIGYKQDDQKRYKLINNQPAGVDLLDSDWELFIEENIVVGTYAEIKALRDGGLLIPQRRYFITDYQTITNRGDNVAYVGSIEPIFLTAISASLFSRIVTSSIYSDDYLEYDMDDDNESVMRYGEYQNGPTGGDIDISNITATTFDIDIPTILDANFYLSLDDNTGNYYEFYASDEGTGFSVTDLGGGNSRITILQPIDLTTVNSYIYMDMNYVIFTRPGVITKRKDLKNNVSVGGDFRNIRKIRYRIDSTAFTVYDSATVYNQYDIVVYNGNLWKMIDNISGTKGTPGASSGFWVLVVNDVDNTYLFLNNGGYAHIGGMSYQLDMVNYRLMPLIGTYDESTGDVVNVVDDVAENIDMASCDNLLITQPTTGGIAYSNVTFDSKTNDNTYFGMINDTHFFQSQQSVLISSGVFVSCKYIETSNTIITGYVYGSYMYRVINGIINNINSSTLHLVYDGNIRSCDRSELGGGSNYNIRNIYNSVLGSNINSLYLLQANSIKLAGNSTGIYSHSTYFTNFEIGKNAQRINIGAGTILENSKIGDNWGNSSFDTQVNYSIRNAIIGNNFGYNSTNNITGSGIQFSNIGNNVWNINAEFIYISDISHGVNNINATHNINATKIGPSTNTIFADSISDTTFDGYNYNINTNGGSISMTRFGHSTQGVTTHGHINKCEFMADGGYVTFDKVASVENIVFKPSSGHCTIPATNTWQDDVSKTKTFERITNHDYKVWWMDILGNIVAIDPTI